MDVGGTWWGQNRWNEGPVVETEANVSGGGCRCQNCGQHKWGRGAVVEIVGGTGAVVEVVAKVLLSKL